MGTWSINPSGQGATISSSGLITCSKNDTGAERTWTIQYTDDDGCTASTSFTQASLCPSGVTVIPNGDEYTIVTNYTHGYYGTFDYKVTFNEDKRNDDGFCSFYVDAAYKDNTCQFASVDVEFTGNGYYLDKCTDAEEGGETIGEYGQSINCYQYGFQYGNGDGTKLIPMILTNEEDEGTASVLVEMHNEYKLVGVEFIFSGEGWTTLQESVQNGKPASLAEYTSGGDKLGVILDTHPKYTYYKAARRECSSFYGNIPCEIQSDRELTKVQLYANYGVNPLANSGISMSIPSDWDINNPQWSDGSVLMAYLTNPTASTDSSNFEVYLVQPEKMHIQYGNMQYGEGVIHTNNLMHPTTNIPSFPVENRTKTIAWGEYGPSVGKGFIYAIQMQMPEDPSTENIKIIYYLHTRDND